MEAYFISESEENSRCDIWINDFVKANYLEHHLEMFHCGGMFLTQKIKKSLKCDVWRNAFL